MKSSAIMIEHALLGFLYQQPLHGYELYRRFTDPAGIWLIWRIKQSQLYALLIRLETEGHVLATLYPQESRPPRKIFHLTEYGQNAYREWVESPVAHGRLMRQEFLAKLYFARQEREEVAQRLIERQYALCHEWLAAQQTLVRQSDHSFEMLVIQFRINQIEAVLAWLRQYERQPVDAVSIP